MVIVRFLALFAATFIMFMGLTYYLAIPLFLNPHDSEFGRIGQAMIIGYFGGVLSFIAALVISLWQTVRRRNTERSSIQTDN